MEQRLSSPIAQVDPRFARWRRVRTPLFAALALVVVVVSGLFVRSCVVDRAIRADLATAAEQSSRDTVEGHEEALAIVERLYADYPTNPAVRTRYAWQHVLMALRLGPADEHVRAARAALGGGGEDAQTALAAAARAGLALTEGEAASAEQLARTAVEQAPSCRECAFVLGLSLVQLDRAAEAVPVLDQARQGLPPFLPALAALGETLRELGRYPESLAALQVLAQVARTHRGAVVQSVLLELDKLGPGPAGAKVLGPLRAHIETSKVNDAHPLRAAYEHYAKGRLDLLEGDAASAAGELGAAAKVLPRDQAVAAWHAIALRRSGRHLEAVEALRAFPDAATTSPEILLVRAEVLLDLHRVRDAAAPLAVLARKNVKGALLLEGRRLLSAGEPRQAEGPLKAALGQGHEEAIVDLGEVHVLRGRVDEARELVRSTPGTAAVEACSKGLQSWILGATPQARARFEEAAKAGGRCGASLQGRYLLGTGSDETIAAGLAAALEEREDARDRVAYARSLLRTKGGVAARAELDRVRAMEPQGALVLAELAAAYAELGLGDLASEVAREGVGRSKGHPLVVALAARLAREAGRLEEADTLLSEALQTRSKAPELLLEKAAVLFEQRRFPEAEEASNGALAPGPGFGEAACLRTVILERRGNQQEAQTSLMRAGARAQTRSGALEASETKACLVEHFIRRGRPSYGKARGNLFLLRQARIVWPQISFLGATLSELEGEPDDAAAGFRKAIALDRAHRPSWKGLARLGVLSEDERATFELMWPGQQPGGG